jgi:hypothetical protein
MCIIDVFRRIHHDNSLRCMLDSQCKIPGGGSYFFYTKATPAVGFTLLSKGFCEKGIRAGNGLLWTA